VSIVEAWIHGYSGKNFELSRMKLQKEISGTQDSDATTTP